MPLNAVGQQPVDAAQACWYRRLRQAAAAPWVWRHAAYGTGRAANERRAPSTKVGTSTSLAVLFKKKMDEWGTIAATVDGAGVPKV